MQAVQKESIPVLPAADPAGFPRQLPDAAADIPEHLIPELPSVLLVERMEAVDVTDNGIQNILFVQMVEPFDIAEEVVFIKQARQLVTLRIPYQVTILRKLDAFGNTRLDNIDIRKRLWNEVHGADLQAVQFSLLING